MYFLGGISGSSGIYSNVATGPSGIATFAIPQTTKAVYLQPSASGIAFAFASATGASFVMAPGMMGQLDGPALLNGPFKMIPPTASGMNPVIAVQATQGGFWSVAIWMTPTS